MTPLFYREKAMIRQQHSESEEDLVRRAIVDLDAFRELYHRFLPRIYTYISYRVPGEDAEDLVADVFLAALKGLQNFDHRGEGSFAAWLFGIARNLVYSSYRGQVTRPRLDALDFEDELISKQAMPEETLMHAEQVHRMRALIETLAPRQQEVIRLRFFAGLHNNEVAQLLNLDERTVAAYLYRGLQTLHHRFLKENVLAEGKDLDGGSHE